MIRYNFSNGGATLTLYDSYAVPKADFQKTLNQIKSIHGNMPIFQRTDKSLKRELAVHNFLYMVGYKREWVYMVLGLLVWPFIK